MVQSGIEALRDPAMVERVHEHLKADGESPRDAIGATLGASDFWRKASGGGGGTGQPLPARSISQSA
jgi:hypothetical protein